MLLTAPLLAAAVGCGGGGGGSGGAAAPPNRATMGLPPPTAEQLNVARTTEFYRSLGLEVIGADHAYARGLSGQGVTVGLLDLPMIVEDYLPPWAPDSGAGSTWQFLHWYTWNKDSRNNMVVHEDLKGKFTPDDPSHESQQPPDRFGTTREHGMISAGLIAAAKNGRNSHGVAYNARIMFARVDNRLGTPEENYQRLGRNLADLVGRVPIINFAYGIQNDITSVPQTVIENPMLLGNLIGIMRQQGTDLPMKTVFVLPTGNDGSMSNPAVPASIASVVTDLQPITLAVTGLDYWQGRARRQRGLPENQLGQINGMHTNPCGAARDYCLAAPASSGFARVGPGDAGARHWHTATSSDTVSMGSSLIPDGEQVTSASLGTSWAAAVTSGSLAVLKEAFPGLGNHELVARLLRSANKQAPYNDPDIYGQGMLDLKAALEPIGAMSFRGGGSLATASTKALRESWMQPAAALGDALSNNNHHLTAFDELDTPFAVPLASLSDERGSRVAAYELRMQQYADDGHRMKAPWRQEHDVLGSADGFAGALPGLAQAPLYWTFANGTHGLTVYTDPDHARHRLKSVGASAWTRWQNGKLTVTPSLNWLREDDSLLYGRNEGAFADVGSSSYGMELNSRLRLGAYSIRLHTHLGRTSARGNLMLRGAKLLHTEFAAGVERKAWWRPSDSLALSWRQPLRANSGHINMTAPTGRTIYGDLHYQTMRINATPSGREQEISLSYVHRPSSNSNSTLRLRLSRTFEPGHREHAPPETDLLLLYSHSF